MSTKEKGDNSYLHLVYILLKIVPYAIEKYIERNYPGGFICRSVISLMTCDRSVVSRRVMGKSVISFVTCDTSMVFRRVRSRSVISQ